MGHSQIKCPGRVFQPSCKKMDTVMYSVVRGGRKIGEGIDMWMGRGTGKTFRTDTCAHGRACPAKFSGHINYEWPLGGHIINECLLKSLMTFNIFNFAVAFFRDYENLTISCNIHPFK